MAFSQSAVVKWDEKKFIEQVEEAEPRWNKWDNGCALNAFRGETQEQNKAAVEGH